jgi:hypothetical protein
MCCEGELFERQGPADDLAVAVARERERNAEEVALMLLALFGDADAAEEMLAQAIARHPDHAPAFWREVVTYLAQVRG